MSFFRSFNRFILIGLALLGLSVSSANAALTSMDWQSSGDGLLTGDDNGLQWLDLSLTRGMSYNQVTAQLGAGGDFEGFQYATRTQVEGLWDSAGGDNNFYSGYSTQNNGVFDVLAPLWGDTYCQWTGCTAGDGYSIAITSTPGLTSGRFYATLSSDWSAEARSIDYDEFHSYWADFWPESYDSRTASALLRVNPVPVPAAVWLFGTALVGLVGFIRRRKAA